MATALTELKQQMERDGYFKDGFTLEELVLFGEVSYTPYDDESFVARLGHCTDEDEWDFTNNLSKMYIEEGYGYDPIYGTVWLTDRTFYVRLENDGCGRWQHFAVDPPKHLDPNGTFAS